MNKELYIHIGTSKTGTSAIQKWLLENSEFLNRNGYYYPSHKLDSNGISGGNASFLHEHILKGDLVGAKERLEEILSSSKFNKVILSCESLYMLPMELHEIVPNAKIVVYFRDQVGRIESSYHQSIKKHQLKKSFSKWVDHILKGDEEKNYSGKVLWDWERLYGTESVVFRPYDKNQFDNGDIVSDFIKSIGIEKEHSSIDKAEVVNVGYSPEALQYKLLINQAVSEYDLRKDRLIDRALQAYSAEFTGKRSSLYSQEMLEKIKAKYQDSNDEITKKFMKKNTYKLSLDVVSLGSEFEINKSNMNELTRYVCNLEPEVSAYLVDNILSGVNNSSVDVRLACRRLLPILGCARLYKYAIENLNNDFLRCEK